MAVAGGWQHRTRKNFAEAIPVATGLGTTETKPLSQTEALVLLCVRYFRPITRGEFSPLFGKEVSRAAPVPSVYGNVSYRATHQFPLLAQP